MIFVLMASTAFAETLYYEPDVSTISGTLKKELFYGAPNYGENPKTDAKEPTYVLYLDKPISVKMKKGSDDINVSREDVKKISLEVENGSQEFFRKMKDLVGRKVTATGKLWGGFNGHHHTDVLMWISDIRQAEK